MTIYKLNGSSMAELNPGTSIINRAQKNIVKSGQWKIKTINGSIFIPCHIDYATKEELISKLNSIDVYLQNGWLYIDNHKYNVKLMAGFKESMNFSSFSVVFQTDEFEYEVYPYTAEAPYAGEYNPLSSYNFSGTMDPVVQDLDDIEIDPTVDNIVTGEFACLDGVIYSSYVPEKFVQNGSEIERQVDISI